ncbi:MAG: Gfo/Idh/MocA family oxidoreductase [Myxococcota bacterium]|nr:Gfo/Idh/MocA family oxidoreductase [Myxococcota bacterium]
MQPLQKVALVGAGYISSFHVAALRHVPGARLVAVCDLNEHAASRIASGEEGVAPYTDLERMLSEVKPDVLHVLTQPDSHSALAAAGIAAGCHVLLEKPVATSSAEALAMRDLAADKGVSLAVNHNFVFSRPFNRLKHSLAQRELGPLKSIRVVWKKPLGQVDNGPWGLWMLRSPTNVLFEIGSHCLSELLSIVDDAEIASVDVRSPKTLPNGATFHRQWSVSGASGSIPFQIEKAFDYGYPQHFVEVEGWFGVARADIENDVFVLERSTGSADDQERLAVNARAGAERARQALLTYGHYAGSKFIKSAIGGPYETSMVLGIANSYDELRGQAPRSESSIEFACRVAQVAESIAEKVPRQAEAPMRPRPKARREPKAASEAPKVLIVGASGFIGTSLLRALLEQGHAVRAIVRNASSLVALEGEAGFEVMAGDFRDQTFMEAALEGIDVVFHLAVAHANSFEGYLRADSEPTVAFAAQCRRHGVRRFVYTGTIDSLDLARRGRLKESDGLDPGIERRNNYARSKAETEKRLLALHEQEGLPLVIVRPGIVLGAGGPVEHVGVASWSNLGRCRLWGRGDHPLPIVLVDDVVKALVRCMDAEGIEGKAYNLSAEPCVSARQYVEELERALGIKIVVGHSRAAANFAGDLTKWLIKLLAGHPDRTRVPSLQDWRCREQHAGFDTTSARDDLDWVPTNDRATIVERGIREPARLLYSPVPECQRAPLEAGEAT